MKVILRRDTKSIQPYFIAIPILVIFVISINLNYMPLANAIQSNIYVDKNYNYSFTLPKGWTQEVPSDGEIAFFTKNSTRTVANFAISYIKGSQLPDSIFALPDDTILKAVVNNMFNSSQHTIIQKSLVRISDGFKFSIISTSQLSGNIPTKSEQILFWLKDGRQYYLTMISDRYNFDQNLIDFGSVINTFNTTSIKSSQQNSSLVQIPSWIKNNAKWWSEGTVSDHEFINGIQYLIQNHIMKVPHDNSTSNSQYQIPTWIKNNAGWWGNGEISDDEFVKGIQYLITKGIIKV